MRAKIDPQGVWVRKIPKRWIQNGEGRTDIFKRVLSNIRLRQCRFVFEGGPTVTIPADELRRIVEGGSEHYSDKIWGPFNIDSQKQTLDGHKINMQVS
jgi:hypothetical protein